MERETDRVTPQHRLVMKTSDAWAPIHDAIIRSQGPLEFLNKKNRHKLQLEEMSGKRTTRLELDVLVETSLLKFEAVENLIRDFDKQFNEEVRRGRKQYASSIRDSGTLGAKYGIHAVFNTSTLSQHAHIDGVGRPGVNLHVDSLSEYNGPLSVAFHMTHHLPTSVGDSVNVADLIYATKGNKAKCKEVAKLLNTLFTRHNADFDIKEQMGTKIEPGTAIIMPKNAAIHRGAPRGDSLEDGEWRIVLYWDMCLVEDKERFENDDMETAEYPIGFDGNKVTWQEIQNNCYEMCPSLQKYAFF